MEKHTHTHTHTKAILNRIARVTGHLNAVKRMVEENRDCSEVLIQLSAIRAQITNMSKIILKDHIEHCIVDAVHAQDDRAIEELKEAIEKLL